MSGANPTSKQVQDLWTYFQRIYGTKIKYKAQSRHMKIIGRTLSALGIMSYSSFMNDYVTTIGRTIYLPVNFKIGVASPNWNLWEQMCLCVHEHQHVLQFATGRIRFVSGFLFRKAKRALHEAQAFRSDLALHMWRYGSLPDYKARAAGLKKYGCSSADIRVVEKYLALSLVTIGQGGVIDGAAKVALHWLNQNASELRHFERSA